MALQLLATLSISVFVVCLLTFLVASLSRVTAYYTPRVLLTVSAAVTGICPYVFDFNESHVYNPQWPGHARFHNGQTMSMGVFLGLATIWKTWFDNKDDLLTAGVLASAYYVTMFSAYYYPGSTGFDSPQDAPMSFPQILVIVPNVAAIGLAYWLEQKRATASNTGLRGGTVAKKQT